MADVGKRFYGPAQPAGSAGTLFTVTTRHSYHVTNITVTNTTTTNPPTTLPMGTDAAATRILDAVDVPAKGVLVLNGYWFMASTEIMQGWQGTAAALPATISGVDETGS